MLVRQLLAPLAVALLVSVPAHAYDIVLHDGQTVPLFELHFLEDVCIGEGEGGTLRIPTSDIDYYETFRSNLEKEGASIISFHTGALASYSKAKLEDGLLELEIDGESKVVIPESLVNFEETVREGSMAMGGGGRRKLASGAKARTVSEARSSATTAPVSRPSRPAPTTSRRETRGRTAEDVTDRSSRSRRDFAGRRSSSTPTVGTSIDRSRTPAGGSRFNDGGSTAETSSPSTSTRSSRGSSSRGGSSSSTSGGSLDNDSVGSSGSNSSGGSSSASRGGRRDPGTPSTPSEPEVTGRVTAVLTTNHVGALDGVQFGMVMPENCGFLNATATGIFQGAIAAPNPQAVSPAGEPMLRLGIVSLDRSAPGEIAQVLIEWRGGPPAASEFRIVESTGSSGGNNIRDFPIFVRLQ